MSNHLGETNKMVSETPIMDAVDAKCDELNVMDAICYAVYEGQKLEIQLNEANERIKRLEEAGSEAICPLEYAARVRIWNEAKEDKL